MKKQQIKLLEDQWRPGYFYGVIQVDGINFTTEIVRKKAQWESKFEIIESN